MFVPVCLGLLEEPVPFLSPCRVRLLRSMRPQYKTPDVRPMSSARARASPVAPSPQPGHCIQYPIIPNGAALAEPIQSKVVNRRHDLIGPGEGTRPRNMLACCAEPSSLQTMCFPRCFLIPILLYVRRRIIHTGTIVARSDVNNELEPDREYHLRTYKSQVVLVLSYCPVPYVNSPLKENTRM